MFGDLSMRIGWASLPWVLFYIAFVTYYGCDSLNLKHAKTTTMDHNPYAALPGASFEEINFVQQMAAGLTEGQQRAFISIYAGRRKNASDVLLLTLIGFLGFAGVQRFVLGQIGMGIVYFLTVGFCWIGTIVDLVNHKSLTNEYNQKMAYESLQIAKMTAQ